MGEQTSSEAAGDDRLGEPIVQRFHLAIGLRGLRQGSVRVPSGSNGLMTDCPECVSVFIADFSDKRELLTDRLTGKRSCRDGFVEIG